MEKIIKVDIESENQIFATYNKSKISKNLLEYIINEANLIKKNQNIKIIINNTSNTNINFDRLLKNAFREEYKNNLKLHLKTNILQIIFFFLGIFFIFLSFQVTNEIWKEIFLIGGWVPIWEMIDLELFSDIRGIKKKNILLKLLDSNIIENNLKNK